MECSCLRNDELLKESSEAKTTQLDSLRSYRKDIQVDPISVLNIVMLGGILNRVVEYLKRLGPYQQIPNNIRPYVTFAICLIIGLLGAFLGPVNQFSGLGTNVAFQLVLTAIGVAGAANGWDVIANLAVAWQQYRQSLALMTNQTVMARQPRSASYTVKSAIDDTQSQK